MVISSQIKSVNNKGFLSIYLNIYLKIPMKKYLYIINFKYFTLFKVNARRIIYITNVICKYNISLIFYISNSFFIIYLFS